MLGVLVTHTLFSISSVQSGKRMVIERNGANWQLDGNSMHFPCKGVVLLIDQRWISLSVMYNEWVSSIIVSVTGRYIVIRDLITSIEFVSYFL